jgi:hypothetical protein
MRLLAAGVAHQDVEPAQATHGVGNQFLAESLLAQITGDGQGGTARLPDQRDHLVGIRLFGRQIIDRDVSAFAGKGNGGCSGMAAWGISSPDSAVDVQRMAAKAGSAPQGRFVRRRVMSPQA